MLESLMNYVPYQEPPVPTTPGQRYKGGYYVGKFKVGTSTYALILAPKATGQSPTRLQWSKNNVDTPGTSSLVDGWANTMAMVAAGIDDFPAAQYCRSLMIDGYADWYFPSVNEVEMIYRNFKPVESTNNTTTSQKPYPNGNGYNPTTVPPSPAYTPTVPAMTPLVEFQINNSESLTVTGSVTIWSSTQSSLAAYPWVQNFNTGSQSYTSNAKTATQTVRAVRRVLIEET
jgi:hypothetical protein